jgi:hypothetical protein
MSPSKGAVRHDRRLPRRRQDHRDGPPRAPFHRPGPEGRTHQQRPEQRPRRHRAAPLQGIPGGGDSGRLLLLPLQLAPRGGGQPRPHDAPRRLPRGARRKLHRSHRHGFLIRSAESTANGSRSPR